MDCQVMIKKPSLYEEPLMNIFYSRYLRFSQPGNFGKQGSFKAATDYYPDYYFSMVSKDLQPVTLYLSKTFYDQVVMSILQNNVMIHPSLK